MKDDTPVYTKQFPIPRAYEEHVKTQIQDLLAAGLIERTKSPYNSALFCIPKGDAVRQSQMTNTPLQCKDLRVVQDFRAINAQTLPDKYSIRTVESCLASVGTFKGKCFSTIDLSSAFWQMNHQNHIQLSQSLDLDNFAGQEGPWVLRVAPRLSHASWTTSCMG